MAGARLNVKFLFLGKRKKHDLKKCAACGRILMKHNKSGLCSNHAKVESDLNRREQLK